MTAPATSRITATVRDLGTAVAAAARQVSRPRVAATVVGITVVVALASWLPLPTPVQLRDWAESVGPWFPLAFLLAHIVVTVVPVPRTAFTLAAGLLFGPALGVAIAVVASTVSAMIAMLLVRAAGWRLNRLVRHRSIDTVDERLRQRGWLAVLSLRLIPAVPFSAINYAAGASTVRTLPYTLATLAGLLPGTAAVV
ncbi:MAG: TVP38/TMEM64 family protein, partial [Mycobacterium sp.]|uniref:TVP38/TMEM64 family protein n=1 Tax=Mycobacterium sp. TaxID=1785 RepID=UPI003F97D167